MSLCNCMGPRIGDPACPCCMNAMKQKLSAHGISFSDIVRACGGYEREVAAAGMNPWPGFDPDSERRK